MPISFTARFPAVSYTRFKSLFNSGSIVSYTDLDVGYAANCEFNSHYFSCFIRLPTEIVDFETFIKPFATQADSNADAESLLTAPQLTQTTQSSATVVTTVAASVTSVTLLAANTSRLGATIFNDSTQSLFLKLGTTASSSSFTVKVLSGGYYETPFGYTGKIDGIWNVALGNARITELT